jgi:hypothetical protein
MRTIGILLLIVGAVGLIWGGVTYFTEKDTVDLGTTEVVTGDRGRVSIPPIYAGAALLVGGLLVGLSARNKHKSEATVTVTKTVDTQP